MMNVKEYQEEVHRCLTDIFLEGNVKKEWDVAKESEDALNRHLYCPRLDLAVGPFNLSINSNKKQEIANAVDTHRTLIKQLYSSRFDGEIGDTYLEPIPVGLLPSM